MFSILLQSDALQWQHRPVGEGSSPLAVPGVLVPVHRESAALDINRAAAKAKSSSIRARENRVDVYFSADVETDGPIPGPYSLLSFALVYAGRFDGTSFERPRSLDRTFYKELRPIRTPSIRKL